MRRKLKKSADVVIAGAGIAGVATAWQLAEQHGVTDVVLVDPRPPLTLTSDKTGANYREWWPQRPMVELARRSIELMEPLAESGGGAFAMNRRGYLYVTSEPAAGTLLSSIAEQHRAAGIEPIRVHAPNRQSSYDPPAAEGLTAPPGADVLLDPALIRKTFPHLAPDMTGAIHARRAGSFDTAGLGRYLLELAERRGARVLRGEMTAVEVDARGVAGVVVTGSAGDLRIATRRLVNAAGPFAGRVAGLLGLSLPLVNVLQQKITFPDPAGAVPRDAPFSIFLDGQELDWTSAERRRLLASPATRRLVERLPGGLHIKPDGSDRAPLVKLGWAFNQEPEDPVWEPAGRAEFPGTVLRGAVRVVPALEAYLSTLPALLVHDAGYYVKTPDELPLIGPASVEGAYVVGGLAGYGGMVACGAGEIAAAWITGGDRSPVAAAFMPERFSSQAHLASLKKDASATGAL